MNFDINVKFSQYMVDCFAGPTLPLNEMISIICTSYVSMMFTGYGPIM